MTTTCRRISVIASDNAVTMPMNAKYGAWRFSEKIEEITQSSRLHAYTIHMPSDISESAFGMRLFSAARPRRWMGAAQ